MGDIYIPKVEQIQEDECCNDTTATCVFLAGRQRDV